MDTHEANLQAAGGQADRVAQLIAGTAAEVSPLEIELLALVRKAYEQPARLSPDDLSPLRAEQYGCKIYPDISSALTLGTDSLAVDCVLLVCENGNYPTNEKGQILYPRYEFFREFAPYIGVAYERALFDTADIARDHGEDVGAVSFVAGIRLFF